MNPQSPSSSSSSEAERDAFETDAAKELPLLNDDKLIAAACATADSPLDHEHIARYLPKWRAFVRHLAEQGNSGSVEAEQFIDAGLADVQNEGGCSTYYSKGAVLECINAALEHVACEKVIAAQNRRDGIEVPGLHPATVDLVRRFAVSLAEKLAGAEAKYGYSDGWLSPDWMDECRAKLLEHIDKGDPRDVAAYCAFLWHHGEATNEPLPISPKEWREQAKARYVEMGDDEATAIECATYLCQQQDWLGGEIQEPRDAVQDDLRERPMPAVSLTATPPSLPIDFKQASEEARVYVVATGETHEGQETYTRHDVRPPLCEAETLYTHPSLKQASEQGGWLPIATAPKDGTEILAAWAERELDDEDFPSGKIVGYTRCVTRWFGNCWDEPTHLDAIGANFDDETAYEPDPSFWQPLPPSPHPEEGALLLGGDEGGKAMGGAA